MERPVPKRLIYKLNIGAFSPDSIPMARLSEYMADLARLLGEPGSVHFLDLEEGSTVLSAAVETESIPKVTQRIEAVKRGEAPPESMKAFDELDRRLAEDNAKGSLRAIADGQKSGAVVITFPGVERPKPLDYGVIKERGSIDGVPTHIGGTGKLLRVILTSANNENYTNIEMPLELALQITDQKCFHRKTVRLHGVGRWYRDESGAWALRNFRADSFEVLKDASLREALEHLRSMPSGWDEIDDPAAFLRDLDSEPNERLH